MPLKKFLIICFDLRFLISDLLCVTRGAGILMPILQVRNTRPREI